MGEASDSKATALVAFSPAERIALYKWLRGGQSEDGKKWGASPAKGRKERSQRRRCTEALGIDRDHIRVVTTPAGVNKDGQQLVAQMLTLGRIVGKGTDGETFERLKKGGVRAYELTAEVVAFWIDLLSEAEIPEQLDAELYSEIEERLLDVKADRYKLPDGIKPAGEDEIFVALEDGSDDEDDSQE